MSAPLFLSRWETGTALHINGMTRKDKMRLYFARHGESEANVLKEFSNRPGKHGLTEKGKRQAEQLADNLKDIHFSALYCSPVLRAIQTAEIVANRLNMAYEIEDALREYDVGILEGKSDEASWKRYWEVHVGWMEGRNRDVGIEGGESYNDIRERFLPFIGKLEEEYRATEMNILLIGHGGTYRCMLPLLLSNVDHSVSLASHVDYTTCVMAELRGREWVCVRWGEKVFEG